MRPSGHQLRQPRTLRAGEAEVQLRGDAGVEQVEVLGQRQHRLQHVQVVHALRVELHQRLGQEVGLLLVVAFQADAVAGFDHRFEQRPDGIGAQQLAAQPPAERLPGACQACRSVVGAGVPVPVGHGMGQRVGDQRTTKSSQTTTGAITVTPAP